MLTRSLTCARLYLTTALIVGTIPASDAAGDQNGLVNVTPLGSHAGELCARDRALLFEDPTGVRILYDPGQTTDETDPRLGEVHAVLLSHAHPDHIGTTRPSRSGGTCAAPATGAANSSSNVATIAALKNAAVMTSGELSMFLSQKIQVIRGVPTPQCVAGGLEHETTVPMSSACTAVLGTGGSRAVRRGGAAASVRITAVQALHSNNVPAALVDAPGLPPGLGGYAGLAEGFVIRFTNGLTAYLTGDTGIFADIEHVIAKTYRPNLVVINIGPGNNGPNSIGPEDAVHIIQNMVRPSAVMPSHVGEQATSGGTLRNGTLTELFARGVGGLAQVVLPVSDVTLSFDGEGRCIGCPR